MSNKIITAAISTVLTIGLASTSTSAQTDKMQNLSEKNDTQTTERCYGVCKAGQNDCATAKHGCAGDAQIDNDKEEWITVPSGLCNKITGGAISPKENKK